MMLLVTGFICSHFCSVLFKCLKVCH